MRMGRRFSRRRPRCGQSQIEFYKRRENGYSPVTTIFYGAPVPVCSGVLPETGVEPFKGLKEECSMNTNAAAVFTKDWADSVFPPQRTDDFFDALFGGAEDGAYDISLRFVEQRGATYEFALDLKQRPGKCLACNLTHGLPQVFARHPIINVKGVAEAVAAALGKSPADVSWKLSATREQSSALHVVPLLITVGQSI